MRKIKKQQHFYLGKTKNIGYLFFKKTFSNIFLTLTDCNKRTIVCKTSGSSGIKGSKRRKKVPYALELIVKELNYYLKLYKITQVYLILKIRINTFFYYLIKELNYYGIKIIQFYIRRPIAFNGIRGRKLRRI